MIKPRLKNIHCPCRDNSIPQPVPLLTNPASKLELPHVQAIPLLEQFKTVPPPSTISYHLKKSIRVQILKTPQNLEDLNQVSPQESCLKSSDIGCGGTFVLECWKLDILTDIVLNKMWKCIEYNALNKNVLNKIVEKNKVCVCFNQLLEQQLLIELIELIIVSLEIQ